MIVVVPSVLILLLKYVLEGQDASFDRTLRWSASSR